VGFEVVRNRVVSIIVASAALFGISALRPEMAQARETAGRNAAELSATYAAVGGVTRTPYGWVDFCGRQPAECHVALAEPMDVELNAKTLSVLDRINRQVNLAIEPVSNMDHWGTMLDHWDYPVDGKGDCKIYALEKRRELMALGFPRQALLMTIVRDLEGNGHTILTVKTDRGEIILDNMVDDIKGWEATGYTFIKRQSQRDPNQWVSIGPAPAPFTTAKTR
jgi:predicted transglutaminase-like cysteine proteinase